MKRLIFPIVIVSLFFIFLSLRGSDAAVMEDYCAVPPYVIQNVPPNVMIVLDNSGSMFNFSYFDGFNTTTTSDDNSCTNTASPCTGFLDPGTYPTFKYYGYFNPDSWYDYQSNRFIPTALKSARGKASTEWDGNFLNWLTMRRVDIIRKVMTGGRTTTGEGSGYDRLIGEIADYDGRGKYKRIANADLYTPYSGNRKFYVYSGSSNPSYFGVRNDSGGGDGTGNEATYNVAVRVPSPVEGVLQDVVGTKARLGLSFYKVNTSSSNQGGFVQVYVSGGSLSSTVNQINLTRPRTNTPLAEALWTEVGYFAQQSSIPAIGSPGPRYASGNYQINNTVDPFNQGTGGQPRYPSCAKSYVLLVTDGEPCADGNLPATLSDYASGKSIYNCSGTGCPAVGSFPASTFPSCSGEGNSSFCNGIVSGCYVAGIEDVALFMHTTDLRNNGGTPNIGKDNIAGIQNLTLYAVFAFGKGSTLLRYAAINGGFEDSNGNNIPDLQSEWDQNGDGEPDTFYEAMEGYALEQSLRDAFSSLLRRAASGTAASVLASGEGSGANIIQAVFYPRRRFGNDIISWTGSLQNLWYYIDPSFTCSSIREDTTQESPDRKLNLVNDDIVQLYFDTAAQQTRARRFIDSNGDGCAESQTTTVSFDDLFNLWEAGKLLWSRNITTDPRTIYTPCVSGTTCIGTTGLANFLLAGNASALAPYLQATDLNGDGSIVDEAQYLIRFMHGEGLTTEDLDGDGVNEIIGVDQNGDGIDDFRRRTVRIGSDYNVWKLGDILDSTPKIASWIPLNTYNKVYKDATYGPEQNPLLNDPADPTKYITTADYKNRGMVFAGGNDGMLHAFKLGKLELPEPTNVCSFGSNDRACLSGANLGREVWAFIPKNALPYLKYFSDPEYCHVYSVDLSPFIFDASINGNPGDTKDVNSWRTILIGGMRFGGACRGTTATCTDVSGDGQKDCVNTPVDVSSTSIGFSSYFALDITDTVAHPDDPTNYPPKLLWEFSNPQLGFATTGPAVVKIVSDKTKNGDWFVVFGSGPTGPIDTTNWQFLGRSDQNLRFFVVDLKTGNLLRTIDTGIQYAFAGSIINSTYDHKLDNYSDDAIYIGYVKRTTTSPYTWTNGGVGRLVLHDPVTKIETADYTKWAWSTVMDNIGAVTSSVTHLYNTTKNILWLFFGTGRYYFEQGPSTDDQDSQRTLYGVKETCINPTTGKFDPLLCTTVSGLTNVTSIADVPTESTANDPAFKGWYINLDLSGNYTYNEGGSDVTRAYFAERTITDPVASTSSGVVFFTTYKPYNDECGLGGKGFIWAVVYNTGGAPGSLLKGKVLVQVSTGSIEQVDISTAFTAAGGRKTGALEGVPPTAQGSTLISQPKPSKRILHMRER